MLFEVLFLGLVGLSLSRNVQLEMEKLHSIANSYVPDERIIGGNTIPPLQYVPFMAYVVVHNSTNKTARYSCGGSLITTQHVLTAAHCLESMEVEYVTLGARDIGNKGKEGLVVGAESFIYHERYVPRTLASKHDVGVIKLNQDLKNSMQDYGLETVTLESASAFNTKFIGARAVTFGWGRIHDDVDTTVLHGVDVNIISNQECLRLDPFRTIHDGNICTSGENVVGTCKGDSGGPLMYNGKQLGITSRGVTEKCEASEPSVYIRVAAYRDWIDTQVRTL